MIYASKKRKKFAYVKKKQYFCAAKVIGKRIMKKTLLFFAAMSLSISLAAQNQNETYLAYIEQWKDMAIREQIDYGVPAAITMAQALLESSAGQSELAVNAKNHFGIKCTKDWFGGVYYYDDDSAGECFRQYGDAAESFKDHSLFLKRPRYSTCFEIAVQDYEAWAYRLRDCGYATDYMYAPKLVKIIETYHLDTLTLVALRANEPEPQEAASPADTAQVASTPDSAQVAAPQPRPKRPLKAEVVHRTDPIMVIHNDPEPEYVVPLTAREERDSFLLMHPKKRCNGVMYVVAREGDTYANVAFRLNVRERDLREDNDALGRDLAVGDRIYLAAKKKTGDKDFVWTHTGQSFWQLCQEEGVSMTAMQELNEMDPRIRTFRTRQKIYLRKVKEEKAPR